MNKELKLKELDKKINDIELLNLKELKEERQKLRKEIDLEKRELKVGKYFVYRNNHYSCPEKDSDYWDTFYKILSVEGYGFKVLEIQIDSYDKSSIVVEEKFDLSDNYYEECTKEEFDKNYNKINKIINDLSK